MKQKPKCEKCLKFHEEGIPNRYDFINVVCDCECHSSPKQGERS